MYAVKNETILRTLSLGLGNLVVSQILAELFFKIVGLETQLDQESNRKTNCEEKISDRLQRNMAF